MKIVAKMSARIICLVGIASCFFCALLSRQIQWTINDVTIKDETSSFDKVMPRKNAIEEKSEGHVITDVIHTSVVVYNRVPKCGSSTMRWIVKELQKNLTFTLLDINLPHLKQHLDETTQAEMVANMKVFQINTFYIRHLHFIDFSRFNADWPTYINVIRDPVERFISHFYYMRNGFYDNQGKVASVWAKNLSEEKRNISLNDCLLQDAVKCVKSNSQSFLAFFCGHERFCRNYDLQGLAKAKRNVVNHFAAVGLVEDLPNTLKIFQALLPRYFTGATKLSLSEESARTKTFNKADVTSHAKSLLRDALSVEMEFYYFVRFRFYKQLNELKRKKLIL